jgi:hypothetical protein
MNQADTDNGLPDRERLRDLYEQAATAPLKQAVMLRESAWAQVVATREHERAAAATVEGAEAQKRAADAQTRSADAQMLLVAEQRLLVAEQKAASLAAKDAADAARDTAGAQKKTARWTLGLAGATALMAVGTLVMAVFTWYSIKVGREANAQAQRMFEMQMRPCLLVQLDSAKLSVRQNNVHFEGRFRNFGAAVVSSCTYFVGPVTQLPVPVDTGVLLWPQGPSCTVAPQTDIVVRGDCPLPVAMDHADSVLYLHVRCSFRGEQAAKRYYIDQLVSFSVSTTAPGQNGRRPATASNPQLHHLYQGIVVAADGGRVQVKYEE